MDPLRLLLTVSHLGYSFTTVFLSQLVINTGLMQILIILKLGVSLVAGPRNRWSAPWGALLMRVALYSLQLPPRPLLWVSIEPTKEMSFPAMVYGECPLALLHVFANALNAANNPGNMCLVWLSITLDHGLGNMPSYECLMKAVTWFAYHNFPIISFILHDFLMMTESDLKLLSGSSLNDPEYNLAFQELKIILFFF